MPHQPTDQELIRLAEALAARQRAARASRGGARASEELDEGEMDPNDLAALAAGSPDDHARALLIAEVGVDDASLIASVYREAAARAPAETAGWVRGLALAVAACAVLGIGLLFAQRAGSGQVEFGAGDLHRVFAKYVPEDPMHVFVADVRSPAPPRLERGGVHLVSPQALIRDPRPTLRWAPVRGARSYRIHVLDDEGRTRLEATASGGATSLAWPPHHPPLDDGQAYVWTVRAGRSGLQSTGSVGFSVVPWPQGEGYVLDARQFDAVEDSSMRALLRAYFAAQQGYLLEARALLRDPALEQKRGRRLALELRAYLNARLGPARTP